MELKNLFYKESKVCITACFIVSATQDIIMSSSKLDFRLKMDHDGNREKVCICCMGKSGGMVLNDTMKALFAKHVYKDFGDFYEDEEYLPKGLCAGCKRKLLSLESQDEKQHRKLGLPPDYVAMLQHIKTIFNAARTRSSGDYDSYTCPCEYCFIGKASGRKIPVSQFVQEEKKKRGRDWSAERPEPGPSKPSGPTPSTSGSSSSSGSSTSKSGSAGKPRCFDCGQIKAPGHPHQCGRTGKLQAMWELASPKTRDMFTTKHLKEKFEEAKEAGKEGLVSLASRFGPPLEIKAKNAKENSIILTKEMLDQFRLQMDVSKTKALKASRFFKRVTGAKLEPYLQEYVMSSETCLTDFFETRNLEWTIYEKDPDDTQPRSRQKLLLKKVIREAVICSDVDGLKFFLLMQRYLDENSITKIGKILTFFGEFSIFYIQIRKYLSLTMTALISGLDSGRDFFKVCLTIHDKEERDQQPSKGQFFDKQYLNSGVKKVVILAAVEDCSERYENVKAVLEALGIDELDYVVAADGKMQNEVMGMSAPGCTHPCIYCEARYFKRTGTWDETTTVRTFGSCRKNATDFEMAEEKAKIPANFMNNIHQPLIGINEPDHKEVIDIVAICSLHLDLGIGNKLLFKANELAGSDLVNALVF